MEKKITRTIDRTYATIFGYDKNAKGMVERTAVLFGKIEDEKELFFAVATADFIPCDTKSIFYDSKKYAMSISDFIAHAVQVKDDTKLSRTEKWIIRTINKTSVTLSVFSAAPDSPIYEIVKRTVLLSGKWDISDAKEICENLNKEDAKYNLYYYGVEKCESIESKYAVNYIDFVAFGTPCDEDEDEDEQ